MQKWVKIIHIWWIFLLLDRVWKPSSCFFLLDFLYVNFGYINKFTLGLLVAVCFIQEMVSFSIKLYKFWYLSRKVFFFFYLINCEIDFYFIYLFIYCMIAIDFLFILCSLYFFVWFFISDFACLIPALLHSSDVSAVIKFLSSVILNLECHCFSVLVWIDHIMIFWSYGVICYSTQIATCSDPSLSVQVHWYLKAIFREWEKAPNMDQFSSYGFWKWWWYKWSRFHLPMHFNSVIFPKSYY